MRQNGGRDLRQVHVAAAPQPDQAVRPAVARPGDALLCDAQRRLGLAPVEHINRNASLGKRRLDLLGDAGADEHRIGHEQGPLQFVLARDVAQLRNGARAEDDLPGGVEGEGGSHGRRSAVSESKVGGNTSYQTLRRVSRSRRCFRVRY
jgi:hypothetical protein